VRAAAEFLTTDAAGRVRRIGLALADVNSKKHGLGRMRRGKKREAKRKRRGKKESGSKVASIAQVR
jgi:hypothetical protein